MLPELGVLPVLPVLAAAAMLPNGGAGVCARLDAGNNSAIATASAKATPSGARQRRLRGDFLAPRAHTSATIRVTSEVAKANHRQEATPARGFSRAATVRSARAAELAPMVNGVRTDMVNERLIYGGVNADPAGDFRGSAGDFVIPATANERAAITPSL
jgi:hypothetical protein